MKPLDTAEINLPGMKKLMRLDHMEGKADIREISSDRSDLD